MTIVWGSGASTLLCIHNFLFLSIPIVTTLQVSYTSLQRASILQAQGLLLRPQCQGVERTDNRFGAPCRKGCEHWSAPNHNSQFVGAGGVSRWEFCIAECPTHEFCMGSQGTPKCAANGTKRGRHSGTDPLQSSSHCSSFVLEFSGACKIWMYPNSEQSLSNRWTCITPI